ncbi:hypothetical protein AgCh_024649 [Apium graveolens]
MQLELQELSARNASMSFPSMERPYWTCCYQRRNPGKSAHKLACALHVVLMIMMFYEFMPNGDDWAAKARAKTNATSRKAYGTPITGRNSF